MTFNFNLNNSSYNIYNKGLNLSEQKKKSLNAEQNTEEKTQNQASNTKVSGNDVLSFLAAGSADMVALVKNQEPKTEKIEGIEKYNTTIEKLKNAGYEESISKFMSNFEANYDEILETLGEENLDTYFANEDEKYNFASNVVDNIYSKE